MTAIEPSSVFSAQRIKINSIAMATETPQDVAKTSGGNLCTTCSVIPFNDELLASFMATQDTREPCWDIAAAAERCLLGNEYYDLLDNSYPLDYRVIDSLPTLPYLEQSAFRGCEFCSLLRLEIIRAEFDYTGFVEITLAYHLGRPDSSEFSGLGIAALVARLTWRPEIPSVPPASPKPDVFRPDIIFAVESDNADVASWLKIPRLRKEHPLCEENIRFMTDELTNCVLNCNHYRATGFLPSRLLDLGPRKTLDSIRLIDSSQIIPTHGSNRPRYAALSYCWGSALAIDGVEQLHAKVDSIDSMRRHVPKWDISPVTLDAIKVCKALSVRYLWVDSLCIIQDDVSDWERESASMTLIYSNAFVTIATPSSTTSNQGFLVRCRRHVAVPFQSRVVPGINGHYNLVASGTCHSMSLFGWPSLDVYHTSWASRGWTLQEFEMSNRLLIFGESMTHFYCRHVVSENGYRQDRRIASRMVHSLDHDSDPRIFALYWPMILASYGKRIFTFVDDKLPGISGMAKYIADKNDDAYLAGLWKSELPSSLLWHVSHHRVRKYHLELADLLEMLRSPTPYIAPSWSPVRLDLEVDLTDSNLDAESTVVHASVISVGKNPFGRLKHGRIRIQGRTTQVLSDLAMLRCYDVPYMWYNRDRGAITYYRLDWVPEGEICNRGELLILLIASTEESQSPHTPHHAGSLEAAQHCCTHKSDDSMGPSLISPESHADQDSDETEVDGDSSLSRSLAVAQSLDELETEGHIQASSHGADRLVENKPDTDDSRAGSEEQPYSSRVNNKDALGLLVHRLSGTDIYVRVGWWTSMVEDGGGTALFENIDVREIDIV